jgi:hypothetical protein
MEGRQQNEAQPWILYFFWTVSTCIIETMSAHFAGTMSYVLRTAISHASLSCVMNLATSLADGQYGQHNPQTGKDSWERAGFSLPLWRPRTGAFRPS